MCDYGMYGFLDPTFLLVILGLVISGIASAYVNSTFRRYDQVRSKNSVAGTQVAWYILQSQQTNNVGVQQIARSLADSYNSGDKMLSLSQAAAQSTSATAIGVTTHGYGRAIRDTSGYILLKIRTALVPAANFGSMISFPLVMVGVLLSWNSTLINIGIFAFSLTLFSQLVTLPVESNASRWAVQILNEGRLLTEGEVPMARHVLFAAALTYVAAALSTSLQLLCLVLLLGGNRRD